MDRNQIVEIADEIRRDKHLVEQLFEAMRPHIECEVCVGDFADVSDLNQLEGEVEALKDEVRRLQTALRDAYESVKCDLND